MENRKHIEKRVNTNGADIDVYFTNARDGYNNLSEKCSLFRPYLKHSDNYSITGLQYKDDKVLCIKLYKTKMGRGLVATKLTSLEMTSEEFKRLI